jgi:hypothetical protein
MAKGALKITKTDSSGQIHDRYTSLQYINGAYVGGTGGDTSQTGRQLQGQVHINGQSSAQGFIVRQKGEHKFLVEDASANRGVCTLVNTPSPAAGQMNVLLTLNTTNANIASANIAGGATSTYITYDTRSSVTGPVASPRLGDYIIGFTGAASVAQVTAVNAVGNVTVATTGNVLGQTGVSISTCTYASKITNKFVYDFGTDGVLSDNISGGYNPNKFRYHLAAPDGTFIQAQYA